MLHDVARCRDVDDQEALNERSTSRLTIFCVSVRESSTVLTHEGAWMSMEIYVLSNMRLASIDDWQQAIDAEGFGLRLSADTPFEAVRGHLPAWWGDKQAGFECDHWEASELMHEHPEINFGRRWAHALAFRWGADLYACQGANMAATAYA